MRPAPTRSKNLLPPWVQVGDNEAMLARLARPEMRARIEAEIADNGLNNWGRIPSWEAVQVSISPKAPQHAGKTIAALAAARGVDPIDQVCDLLIEDNGATRVLIASISEDDIRTIVRSPDGLGRLRRQLRRRLRHRRAGHAASALLRHVSADHRPLRA